MYKFLISIFCLFYSVATIAQREVDERSPLKDRIYFGGGLGFGTGTGYTQFSLNPILGYMIDPKLSAGLGVTYQDFIYTLYTPSISIQQYGVSPFLRYHVNQQLFLYGEYDIINAPTYISGSSERAIYNRLPIGLGYSMGRGRGRGALNIVGLYDVLYKSSYTGIFQTPWVFRVFFTY